MIKFPSKFNWIISRIISRIITGSNSSILAAAINIDSVVLQVRKRVDRASGRVRVGLVDKGRRGNSETQTGHTGWGSVHNLTLGAPIWRFKHTNKHKLIKKKFNKTTQKEKMSLLRPAIVPCPTMVFEKATCNWEAMAPPLEIPLTVIDDLSML